MILFAFRIFKNFTRHSPSLVTAVFRGLLAFSCYINEELLTEILLLFRDLLLETFALNWTGGIAAEPQASSSSLLGSDQKKRKKKKKKGDKRTEKALEEERERRTREGDPSLSSFQEKEASHAAVYVHRHPEVAAMAIGTALLLLHRVNVILQARLFLSSSVLFRTFLALSLCFQPHLRVSPEIPGE